VEAAKILKGLGNRGNLGQILEGLDEQDVFIQAAIYETISFIARRETRYAREAISRLDGIWLDLDHPEDLTLLFDN